MMRTGNIFSTGLAGMAIALLLAACAGTGPKVVGNYDPATDFSKFETFGFAQPLGSDNRSGRTSVSARLMAATVRELRSRGLSSVSSNPDLMINFFVEETGGASGSNSPFSHGHGGAATWSSYHLRASNAQQISEGTIVVDVFDTRRNMLVFEGFAQDRVTESMRDNLTETVNTAVVDIFSEMP